MITNLRLYAYFDIQKYPITAWEVAIGRIISAHYDEKDKFPISFWFYQYIQNFIEKRQKNARIKFLNELQIELIRQKFFPSKVSRLKGVYFFTTYEDAKRALYKWKGEDFNERFISQVNFTVKRISYYDSDWITDNLIQPNPSSDEWIFNYLSGKPKSKEPLWEVVVEGVGIVVSKELRIAAYQALMKKWPECTPFLATCACAFYYGHIDAGRAVPSIFFKDNKLSCVYLLNTGYLFEHEKEITECMIKWKKEGYFLPFKMPKDPDSFAVLPNFKGISGLMGTYKLDDPKIYLWFKKIYDFVNKKV